MELKLDFNKSQPIDDDCCLWQLQNEFMDEAEKLFQNNRDTILNSIFKIVKTKKHLK